MNKTKDDLLKAAESTNSQFITVARVQLLEALGGTPKRKAVKVAEDKQADSGKQE